MPVVAVSVVAAALVVLVVLWRWIDGLDLADAEKRAAAHLDAAKVAASIAVGGGGLFALYLAARRQRTQELELEARHAELAQRDRVQAHVEQVAENNRLHVEQVASDAREDAAARRITELYAKSVEQLGAEKAPVRLGGLYALERLAQDNPHQRQTVVNVLCAYLRMPYTLPGDAPGDQAAEQIRARYDERAQELEVRLTAERILRDHLRPGDDPDTPVDTFWPDVDLHLTGATLIGFDLIECRLRTAHFDRATFTGFALFAMTTFTGPAYFIEATFADAALFGRATFLDEARFIGATFAGANRFNGVTFMGRAAFAKSTFVQPPVFHGSLVASPLVDSSAWPAGWRPSATHGPIKNREGTWHRLVPVAPDTPDVDRDEPTSTA